MQSILNFSRALEKSQLTEKELKHLLSIALGINTVLQDNLNEIENEERIAAVKYDIYNTFGAPGDWGYGTSLGKALLEVLRANDVTSDP